jgi:hypothetical protein
MRSNDGDDEEDDAMSKNAARANRYKRVLAQWRQSLVVALINRLRVLSNLGNQNS